MGNVSQIFEILAIVIDCIIVICFLNEYFGVKYKYKYKFVLSLIVMSFMFIIAYFVDEKLILQTVLLLAVTILYSYIFLKGNRVYQITTCCMILIVMSTINIVTIQIVAIFTRSSVQYLIYPGTFERIIALLISKLVLMILAYVLIQKVNKKTNLNKQEMIIIVVYLLAMSVISVILLYMVANLDMELTKQLEMLLVTVLLISTTVLAFVLISKINKQKEYYLVNKILKLQLDEQKNNVIRTMHMYDDATSLKHDIDRYILTFLAMLQNNEVEETIKNMEELVKRKLNNNAIYIKDNNIINAVLNEKSSKCSQNYINMKVKITSIVSEQKELEIAIMLSNLLDNAIEAEQKIDEDRKIDVNIFEYNSIYNIIIKNRIMESVLQKNPKLRTDKKDKKEHGIGLKSVKDTVEKFNGDLKLLEEENEFVVHIMIPN